MRELNTVEVEKISGGIKWREAGAACIAGAVGGGMMGWWTGPGVIVGMGGGCLVGAAAYFTEEALSP